MKVSSTTHSIKRRLPLLIIAAVYTALMAIVNVFLSATLVDAGRKLQAINREAVLLNRQIDNLSANQIANRSITDVYQTALVQGYSRQIKSFPLFPPGPLAYTQ